MKFFQWAWLFGFSTCVGQASPSQSVARIWDEQILTAIRIDLPHPPVHARNLFHLSVVMYDAWAVYDPVAVGYIYHGKHTATDVAAARREAISYAAYRILAERYALSRNSAATETLLVASLQGLGYDPDNRTLDPSSPAGVGNRVASAVSMFFINDGALQTQAYKDLVPNQGGYQPINPPLLTLASGTLAIDVNRWQPLAVTNAISQNDIPVDIVQKFLGSQWLGVRPFALERVDSKKPWFDPGPPPWLGTATEEEFRSNVVDVLRRSSELTPDDGVTLDISPAAFGNNALGSNDGTGYPKNPFTGLPYAPNVVKRGDFARVLAEFWADGPNSETPPGHWNVLANTVSDSPGFQKRFGGSGPILDDLEWDVKLYFALNGALHDAACAAWSLKRYYDGWRPIEAIRFMGQRGQSSNPQDLTYDARGLPLLPGLIERVTVATLQNGARHAGLPLGAIVVKTWPGQPVDPTNQYGGIKWILAANWLPYQKKTFVTPAFPGYISGHSTFSRAAAEVLTAITGTPFFPAGMSGFTAPANRFLSFEKGPSETVELQWATYYDAADQAGLSRIWGGIHPPVDDFAGRKIGSQCGKTAWQLARGYFDGSVLATPPALTIYPITDRSCQLRGTTLRGFRYRIQSAPTLSEPFVDDSIGEFQSVDTFILRQEASTSPYRFYRLLREP